MLGFTPGDHPVTPKTPQQRHPIWLTPEAVTAADRLSRVTGLTLNELVEIALLGIDADQLARELGIAGAPPAPCVHRPFGAGRPARVIPIERGRRRHTPSAPTAETRRSRRPAPPSGAARGTAQARPSVPSLLG